MIRKTMLALALTAGSTIALTAPASANGGGDSNHKHYCDCGHAAGKKMCGSSSSSGGTTSTSGGTTSTSGGTTSTSGGTTTTSGGSTSGGSTDVPEPGMLGMMGLGLLGIAYARRRKARA